MAASLKLFREQKAPWAPGGLSPPPCAIILSPAPTARVGRRKRGQAAIWSCWRPVRRRPRKRAPPEKATRKPHELSPAPTEQLTGRELSWELHALSVLPDSPIY